MSKELEKFANAYVQSDFEKIISAIEQSILNIRQNIYGPLLLTNLALRIKESLIKK